ncbi:MAG: sigma 54-interacting transcriptional regulator [Myxococcaceae bacterium]
MTAIDRTQTAAAPTSRPLAFELWVVGPDVHHRVVLQPGTLTVGRGDSCDVRIDHSSVSRQHLIVFVGGGVHVEDVGSRNGTLLNGQPLQHTRRVPLGPSDVLEVGPFRLFLQPAAAERPLSSEAPLVISPAMKKLHQRAAQVAAGHISVLVTGETGAGKDIIARVIHERSPRAHGPFVRLNCAAIAESLLESELFGHQKGAFTGATAPRQGLIESADGGTLFLDEVGELSPALQAKLLHVLETRQVTRVGGTAPVEVDVRFIGATWRRLADESAAGTFRRDLYYRLAGTTLEVPPLRERPDEIVPLAERFAKEIAAGLGRSPPSFTPEVTRALQKHAWPGNVRELRNAIEVAVLTHGDTIDSIDLARAAPPEAPAAQAQAAFALSADELAERDRIIAALESCAGNQTRAAKALGWARSTLASKLALYRIPRPRS